MTILRDTAILLASLRSSNILANKKKLKDNIKRSGSDNYMQLSLHIEEVNKIINMFFFF